MSGIMLPFVAQLTTGSSGALATVSRTLTSLGVSNAGDGASIMDRKFFGFGTDRFGIDINGTLSSEACGDYTITELQEYTIFDTANGSYGTLTTRILHFAVAGGPGPLTKTSFTSLTCPGAQVLNTSASSFYATADGGDWSWTGATNAGNETTADYMGSGTAIITV